MDALIREFKVDELNSVGSRTDYKGLDSLSVAIYITNAEGNIIYFNPAAEYLWGRAPILQKEKWCGSYGIFNVEGKFVPHNKCPMAIAINENRPVRGLNVIASRPNGTYYKFKPFPTPICNKKGKLIGALNMLVHMDEVSGGVEVPQVEFCDAAAAI